MALNELNTRKDQFAIRTCNCISQVTVIDTCVSQAFRQGLAVLMASAVVVLKHETSTLCQTHNFIQIDLKFGVGDYVREVTSPDIFGFDPISGRDATWGQHIRVL